MPQLRIAPSDREPTVEWLTDRLADGPLAVHLEPGARKNAPSIREFAGDDLAGADAEELLSRILDAVPREGPYRLRAYFGTGDDNVQNRRRSFRVEPVRDPATDAPNAQLAKSQEQTAARVMDQVERLAERLEGVEADRASRVNDLWEARLAAESENQAVTLRAMIEIADLRAQVREAQNRTDPATEQLKMQVYLRLIDVGIPALTGTLGAIQVGIARASGLQLAPEDVRRMLLPPPAPAAPASVAGLPPDLLAQLGIAQQQQAPAAAGASPLNPAGILSMLQAREEALEARIINAVRKELTDARSQGTDHRGPEAQHPPDAQGDPEPGPRRRSRAAPPPERAPDAPAPAQPGDPEEVVVARPGLARGRSKGKK